MFPAITETSKRFERTTKAETESEGTRKGPMSKKRKGL